MRKGGGKGKGSSFERKICKELSLWISKGKRKDLFWRSAMSGGRSTVGRKRGEDLAHQAGDISAVHPEGHILTNSYYIECKHYRSLELGRFLFGEGRLATYWSQACREAEAYAREPMLIAKENFTPIMVLLRPGSFVPSPGAGHPGTFVEAEFEPACVILTLKSMLSQFITSILKV
jgi:hypothetical protein